MSKENRIIREYFAVEDINGNETIEILPLTLVDMLLEYESEVLKLHKHSVSQQRELLLAYEKFQNEKILGKHSHRISKQMVDDFLANNCG
jgi:hypothetical protein